MARICVKKESSVVDQVHGPESAVKEFDLIGYATQADAQAALINHPEATVTHGQFPTLLRDKLTVDEFQSHPEEFTGRVTWKRWIPDFIGEEELSGSVSTQTVRVNYAKNHIGDYGPGANPPILSYGALGLKYVSDGIFTPEGFDVEFPVLNFTIRKTYAKGFGNIARAVVLNDYAGKPNSLPWRGFGVQTVKLTGADISDHDDDEDEVSYTFSASPTVVNQIIPSPLGNIVVPLKLGWQLLSITSVPETFDGPGESGFTVEVPHTAHIDELTDTIDLNVMLP